MFRDFGAQGVGIMVQEFRSVRFWSLGLQGLVPASGLGACRV